MRRRALYDEHAALYDTVFADPVGDWVDVVVGVAPPPATLLDAGCGTGRHAEALAARGYAVTLVDGSAAMLALAAARLPAAPAVVADLATLDLGARFDVVSSRGVLNDVVEDAARDAVLASFAAHLRPGGVAVFDVRELEATRERYAGGRSLRRGGFESDGVMDGELVRVVERVGGSESTAVIRPWARGELDARLEHAGFATWTCAPLPERPDRLLVRARAPARSASPDGT